MTLPYTFLGETAVPAKIEEWHAYVHVRISCAVVIPFTVKIQDVVGIELQYNVIQIYIQCKHASLLNNELLVLPK